VRLTEPAIDDLHALARKDPQIVRWCLKKMLLLERDPMAGEPLLGGLIGFRRLVVSDRHWRIVWRVVEDDASGTLVDIAEVWAAVTVQGRPTARIVPIGQTRTRTVTGSQLRQRMVDAAGMLPAERDAWAGDITGMPDVEDFTDPWGDR
jgi:mRNA interferase RelE/StbE